VLRRERRVSPSQVRDNGLVQSDIIAERAYYLDGEPDSAVIGPGTSTLGLLSGSHFYNTLRCRTQRM
jgi:hypothetical protein